MDRLIKKKEGKKRLVKNDTSRPKSASLSVSQSTRENMDERKRKKKKKREEKSLARLELGRKKAAAEKRTLAGSIWIVPAAINRGETNKWNLAQDGKT